MFRGRGVRFNFLFTRCPLLQKRETCLVSSSHQSRVERSTLFKFPIEEEVRLFLQKGRYLAGIKLRELLGMGKEEEKKEPMDWECLPSASFDLGVKIPTRERDIIKGHHFVLDSKLYLGKGCLIDYTLPFVYEDESFCYRKGKKMREIAIGGREVKSLDDLCKVHNVDLANNKPIEEEAEVFDDLCKIYEVDIDNNKLIEVSADSNSIPQLPTPIQPLFLGNIGPHPDVYCLVWSANPYGGCVVGLWVLSSSSDFTHKRQWKPLPIPPAILESISYPSRQYPIFVLLGKLFLSVYRKKDARGIGERHALVSFDPTTAEWAHVDDDFVDTFSLSQHTCSVGSVFGSVSHKWALGVPCRPKLFPDYFYGGLPRAVSLPTFLVKDENDCLSLRCLGSFDEVFDGLLPYFFEPGDCNIILVDLGNGTVCALFYTEHMNTPILAISVFNVVKPLIAGQTLSIQVLVKRIFKLDPEFIHPQLSCPTTLKAFVFTPKK